MSPCALTIAYTDNNLAHLQGGYVGFGTYNASSGYRFDNFTVTTIPEPGPFLLTTLAGVVAGWRVTKRRSGS